MSISTKVEVLHRAAESVGGVGQLSHQLQVPRAELEEWLSGRGEPTIGAFLRAVDIVERALGTGAPELP